jgi:hypothetical protein
VALALGLSLAVAAYLIGPVSGCHINPASTAGLAAIKKTEVRLAPVCIAGQVVSGPYRRRGRRADDGPFAGHRGVPAGWALRRLWVFIVCPLLGGAPADVSWAALRRAQEAAHVASAVEPAVVAANGCRPASHRRGARPAELAGQTGAIHAVWDVVRPSLYAKPP